MYLSTYTCKYTYLTCSRVSSILKVRCLFNKSLLGSLDIAYGWSLGLILAGNLASFISLTILIISSKVYFVKGVVYPDDDDDDVYLDKLQTRGLKKTILYVKRRLQLIRHK
jgi:hypothetical protein